MRQSLLSLCLLGLIALWLPASAVENQPAARPVVLQVRLDNLAISPVTAQFLQRAIEKAERDKVDCLVIMLDTPGGLVDSTRSIVRNILGSKVPVVVYVAPSGARAASAGLFITLAAHKAAMAPGTHIGAAHPVTIGGLPGSPPEEENRRVSPREEKIVADTVAWARTLAEERDRNAEWAARAVRESASFPSSEAVRENVVDLLARDMNELLEKIHGNEVAIADVGPVRLNTKNAEIQTLEMWWGERFLTLLANPNVAFLLLMFGFYGILFELYTPGWGVAGVLGIVCLLLAFFGLAILPVNYAGLALLAVGLALFAAEVFVTSYGALTIAGVVCMVLGGTMLVDSPVGFQRVSLAVVVPIAVGTALITFFLVGNIVRAHRHKVQTGGEALADAEALALEDFHPEHEHFAGMVRARGELWRAVSPTPIRAGQALAVSNRDGLMLTVEPVEPAPPPSSSPGPVQHSGEKRGEVG